MSEYEKDYPDFRQCPAYEPGDEAPSDRSANPTFYDVLEARLARRSVLAGGLATAVATVFSGGLFGNLARAETKSAPSILGFTAIATSETDTIVVPDGYRAQVLAPWGQPLDGATVFDHAATGTDQARQVGSHHDGMHFFPIDGSSTDGLLVMNHEYVDPRFLHAAYAGKPVAEDAVLIENGVRVADEVLKEINAHGVSVARITRQPDGTWVMVDDPRNRRVTASTPMEIAGPVRGAAQLATKFSPDGTRTRGTINNCAHGVTPWNTYLSAEENWAGYFHNDDTTSGEDGEQPDMPREHARYGVRAKEGRYAWDLAAGGMDEFIRFNASTLADSPQGDYRNEPNGFGWIIEFDPFDPASVPHKHTALGRFAHEGVIFAKPKAGAPIVCYSGDDARFEYIYKYVSARPYDPATADGTLLDEGTLYAARFNDDGTGTWLALKPGANGLTPENGFADLADILVNTRLAADMAGATKMDRPEWGAVDPTTGEVYFTLTNNSRRTEDQVDAANPRAANIFGQIVRWHETGDDHSADSFDWDLFVLAGDENDSRDLAGKPLTEHSIFACPDGLWCDPDGRLWIQTDIGEASQNVGPMKVFGNNAMLGADPRTGEIRRFLTGPTGQEITGVIATPDQTTLFINVQHPGATTTAEAFAAGAINSRWPDKSPTVVPRSATVAISRIDGGKVGA